MWIYRAYDADGLPVAEAYKKIDLIIKLENEFGSADGFIIKRIFESWLR